MRDPCISAQALRLTLDLGVRQWRGLIGEEKKKKRVMGSTASIPDYAAAEDDRNPLCPGEIGRIKFHLKKEERKEEECK